MGAYNESESRDCKRPMRIKTVQRSCLCQWASYVIANTENRREHGTWHFGEKKEKSAVHPQQHSDFR